MSASRSSSSAESGVPVAMPMLAEIDDRRCAGRGARTARAARARMRSATRSGSAASGPSQSSSITNSSPPSRPTVSLPRSTRAQPRAELAQHVVAGLVPEAVVDLLEAVESMNSAVTGCRGGGAREHLLDAVEDQRPVRQAGQGVVQGVVLELLGLLAHEPPGALARACERHVEQHQQRSQQRPGGEHDEALRGGRRARARGAADERRPSRRRGRGGCGSPPSGSRRRCRSAAGGRRRCGGRGRWRPSAAGRGPRGSGRRCRSRRDVADHRCPPLRRRRERRARAVDGPPIATSAPPGTSGTGGRGRGRCHGVRISAGNGERPISGNSGAQ